MANPRTSVVVPTFNRPETLRETLRSVLEGEDQDFEIIVANDGSPEDLEAVRSELADPRIVWLDRANRLGMLRNNVDAFSVARGTFVANLHDDDRWGPKLLSTLVPPLEDDPELVLAFADHFIVDGAGSVRPDETDQASAFFGRASLAGGAHRPFGRLAVVDRSIPIQCATVFRRDALPLDQYPDEVGPFYDLWTGYLLSRSGGGAWYHPERLSYYCAHAGSQTVKGRRGNAEAAIYCFSRFLEDSALSPWRETFVARLAEAHTGLALELLLSEDNAGARRHFRQAMSLTPGKRSVAYAFAARLSPQLLRRALVRRRGAS